MSIWTVLVCVLEISLPPLEHYGRRRRTACRAVSAEKNAFEKLNSRISFQRSWPRYSIYQPACFLQLCTNTGGNVQQLIEERLETVWDIQFNGGLLSSAVPLALVCQAHWGDVIVNLCQFPSVVIPPWNSLQQGLSTTSKVPLSSIFLRGDEHLCVRYPQNSATQNKNYAECSSWKRNKIFDFGWPGPLKDIRKLYSSQGWMCHRWIL